MKYSIDKWKVGWIKNWFKYQDQVIFISSTKYSWRPLTAGVPQKLIVGPMLFNICINNVSDETVQLQQVCRWSKTQGNV